MKKLFLLLGALCTFTLLQAQYPLVTIADLQTLPPDSLDPSVCNDLSLYNGDTVRVRGVVLMDGGQAYSASGHQLWLQDGSGPWSGLDVRDGQQDNLLDQFIAGDSVEILGVMNFFGGETQIDPINDPMTGSPGVTLLGSGIATTHTTVDLGDINDNMQVNQLATGEQWEGAYVELTNMTVVQVDLITGGPRHAITLRDMSGNLIQIGDRFPDGRVIGADQGTLAIPTMGTVYDTIRGVIEHGRPNGCLPPNGSVALGYQIFPFLQSDIVVQGGTAGPIISDITRNPGVPTSGQDLTITADVQDPGGMVDTVVLNFAIGITNTNYLELPMLNIGGNLYQATIPSSNYSDGDFLKYYVSSTDDDNITSSSPDVPNMVSNPLFLTIRDNGLQIYDLQFTPFSDGNSGFRGQEVTVTGIVTASAFDLGIVFMQQSGATDWGGIQLLGDPALASLELGDSVSITGTVAESFGFTQLANVTSVNVLGQTAIPTPMDVDPSLFSNYDPMVNEKYEGVLLRLTEPGGGKLFIVEENSDGPGSNFGEYRVGADVFNPLNGSRVLVGRNTGSAPGSLNFSYVNDSMWATNSGVMNVPVYKVSYEDELDAMTGIMYYSFSNMKLLPRVNSDMEGFVGSFGPGVGILDELEGSRVLAYPNPTENTLFVEYSFPIRTDASFVLTDMMGRRISVQEAGNMEGTLSFPTAGLAKGTYVLLTAVNGAVLDSRKIIVK